MTLLPHLRPGFLNLWIFMLLFIIPVIIMAGIRRQVFQKTTAVFRKNRNSREIKFFIFTKFIMLIFFIVSIFIPLQLQSIFLWIGTGIFYMGYIFYLLCWISILKNKNGTLMKLGLYRVSRHPVYVSSLFIFIGAGLASRSYVISGLSLAVGILNLSNAFKEEKICLEVFGDEYKEYMSKTPRWFGLKNVFSG